MLQFLASFSHVLHVFLKACFLWRIFRFKNKGTDSKTCPFDIFIGKLLFRSQFFEPFTADHAGHAKDDEGNAEQLSHVERHSVFKIYLCFFGELNEETGGENQGEAQTKEKAGTNFF